MSAEAKDARITSRRLILRGLVFYRRTHAGVALGAAVATAVIVGALAAGDSVRASLRAMAGARLGRAQLALAAGDRFFRPELARDLGAALGADAAAALVVDGSASVPSGAAGARSVQAIGIDAAFSRLAPSGAMPVPGADEAVINRKLAELLRLSPGDPLILRVRPAAAVPGESPLALAPEPAALRLRVSAVADDAQFGRFNLRNSQLVPCNVFVSRAALGEKLGLKAGANVLLVAGAPGLTAAAADAALRRCWTPADAGLAWRALPDRGVVELRSARVFLEPPAAAAALAARADAQPVCTYFANALRSGARATPYSFVSACGPPVAPADLRDDELVVNDWLAADLGVQAGAEVTLRYYVPGHTRELTETGRTFRVRAVVPLTGPAADPELMPDFAGLADAASCSEWKPGVAIDLGRIRKADEDYWDRHRGTPKAFVSLAAARSMWNSRFGWLTAVRYPGGPEAVPGLTAALMAQLQPAAVGLAFAPAAADAERAAQQGVDFGQLFAGMSAFLVVAALLFAALMFTFTVEQRAAEAGLLMALGFRRQQVRRLIAAEAGVLAVAGGAAGAAAGVLYNRLILAGLNGVWSGAVAAAEVTPCVRPVTVLTGAAVGIVIAFAAVLLASRRLARRPLSELQRAAGDAAAPARGRGRLAPLLAVACLAGAAAIAAAAGPSRGPEAAGAFFGAGALVLAGGLAASRMALRRLAGAPRGARATPRLARAGAARRPGRSLLTAGLLACGVFLIVAVGANRRDPSQEARRRDSGTGGFALYGETSAPLVHDLNAAAGRRALRLESLGAAVRFAQLRVHDGDDASCLNLNRVARPRLLGVDPRALAAEKRFAFAGAADGASAESPWLALMQPAADGAVPAVADLSVIQWGLGKKLGDTLEYTAEDGQPVRLRLAAGLADSIFQGSVLVDAGAFERLFPSETGTRVLLADAPPGEEQRVADALEQALQDRGLELTPAPQRLAEFLRVEDTYLSIFMALGGLGLVLGGLGLGAVVLRNGLERRRELALLRAVGYSRAALARLMIAEHGLLLGLGLAIGTAAAAVAVLPAWRESAAGLPLAGAALVLAGVAASGLAWTALAAWTATRGELLRALREE